MLVKLKPGTDPAEVFQAVGGSEIQHYEDLDWYRITYDPRFDLVSAGRKLLETGQVYYVEPNYRVRIYSEPVEPPNDPIFDRQWGLEMINARAGWKETMGSEEVIIAIVDSGIDHTHPDLDDKVVAGCNFTVGIPGGVPGLPGDDNKHGTHVGGIAAAETGNGIGVAGVAWRCQLMPVKVLTADGYGEWAGIADGIRWAADNGAHVINLSLGGSDYSRFLQEAVEYALEKNVVVVAAAGNEFKYYDDTYPAACTGVISVGALKSDVTTAFFSTKGSHVFLAAPGQGIYSTVPPTVTGKEYDSLRGTSMAAPFVSGADQIQMA